MQESHFLGLFFVHQEVDGLALVAEFTLLVGDLRTDGIVRTATETVIPFVVAPRVYYFLHIIWSIILIIPKII